MPFWAIYMVACGALVFWGWRVGLWVAPALIFVGLFGVRFTPFLPPIYHELASCTVWICVTIAVALHGRHLVALLLAFSAMAYLPLLVVGYRIEKMGILPITSDIFLILAIVACGFGFHRKHIHSDSDRSGFENPVADPALRVASSKARITENHRSD